MKIGPRVSVVMPVYNSEPYLGKAITSILSQTLEDFELIIVDDGSSDSSGLVMKSFKDSRIRIVENIKNFGISESLNRGIKCSQCEYIARLDADDIAARNRLKIQFDILDSDNTIDLCHSNYDEIDGGGVLLGKHRQKHSGLPTEWLLLWGNPIAHPTVMFRKTILSKVGLAYDSSCEPAEDYDLWSRLNMVARFYHIAESLIVYRNHSKSAFHSHPREALFKSLAANDRMVSLITGGKVPSFHKHLTGFGMVLDSKICETRYRVLKKWYSDLAEKLEVAYNWKECIRELVNKDIRKRLNRLAETEASVYYSKGTRQDILRENPTVLLGLEMRWKFRPIVVKVKGAVKQVISRT